MEQAISRSQLRSPHSTPSASPDPDDVARIRDLATDFEYFVPEQGEKRDPDEDEQLEFQLFAPTSTVKSKEVSEPVQKIRLRSETPPDSENAGFILPNRPSEYYFAATSPKFKDAALSGGDIVAMSQQPCPGNAYPWKVLHLPASGLSRAVKIQEADPFRSLIGKVDAKKSRPGKKARIASRVKAQDARKKAEQKAKEAAEKDVKEREKRSQRNREKKLKRREKERRKKAEAQAANGAAAVDDEDDADSSDGD